ncbi:MAG TPA: hypothetical protein DCL21_00515 [Alphaproteobacteria bacterium]|nr:hypothetical protein [Alphaproteobacteria bacterium]
MIVDNRVSAKRKAVNNFIDSFSKNSQQPVFYRKVAKAYLKSLNFDPQQSTTKTIVDNNSFYVRLGEEYIKLAYFDLVLRKFGIMCYFDATKASVSVQDFKVLKMSEISEDPLKFVPKHLEERSAHMDA